jgi:hypothetical protein
MKPRTSTVIALSILSLAAAAARGVQPAVWTHTTEAHFATGKFESTVSTSLGEIALARRIKLLAASDSAPPVVSAVAVAGKTLYAGAGNEGVIYRVQSGKAVKFAELPSTMVACLVWTGKELLAGTGGEKAGLYRVDGRGKAKCLWADAEVKYVWAVVPNADGGLYAATGPEGKVFAIDKAGKGQVIYHADKLAKNILCLIAGAGGKLYAGTDEKGLVIEIDPKAKTGRVVLDAAEKEIAALLLGADGSLLAATSDASKATAEGAKRPATTKAGKADRGKKPPQTKPAPKAEPDKKPDKGPEKKPAEKPAKPKEEPKKRKPEEKPKDDKPREKPKEDDKPEDEKPKTDEKPKQPPPKESARKAPGVAAKSIQPGSSGPPTTAPSRPAGRGPAPPAAPAPPSTVRIVRTSRPPTRPPSAPSPPTTGGPGNAVYAIRPNGLVETVFRRPVTILAMILADEKLILGTGNGGGIYRVTLDGDEVALLADTDAKQVTSLAARGGEIVFATANKGCVGLLERGFARKGTYVAKAMDAKQIAQWGTMQVDGQTPPGTKVTIATRSGNLAEPDEKTWSSWSGEVPLQSGFLPIGSPAGRFLQYRLSFTSNGRSSASISGVRIVHQVGNLAPAVGAVTVQASPKGRTSSETAGGAKVWRHITIQAADQNGDKLRFILAFREVGSEGWITVTDKLLVPKYVWDTRSVGDGRYELRVTASDDPVNPPEGARTGARVSEPFVIDNTGPTVRELAAKVAGGKVSVSGLTVDSCSRVASIYYSVDSQTKWVALLPTDGICDSDNERFAFDVKDLKGGAHRIALRVADMLGNVGFGSVIVHIPE